MDATRTQPALKHLPGGIESGEAHPRRGIGQRAAYGVTRGGEVAVEIAIHVDRDADDLTAGIDRTGIEQEQR